MLHLARRFLTSLWPAGPGPEAEGWARASLLDGERDLWRRLSGPDRRHAVGVARRVEATLGADAVRPVLAAALLHDVGKLTSGLGTFGRVLATLSGAVAGRETAEAWSTTFGLTRRVGLYLRHPQIGADLLVAAGSDPLTATWAGEHHLPPEQWTVDRRLADALKAADDD